MAGNLLVPESVDKFLEKATEKPAACIGDTIADIWFLVFGGIGQAAEKRRIKYACALEAFKADLNAKINAIPLEKTCEPSMQIVGPALEDSKYCIESEIIRAIFANLIASSLNTDTVDNVHPSFSGIAKQLSALDASNLACFKNKTTQPIAEIRYKMETGHHVAQTNFFLGNPGVSDPAKQAISLNCLENLGLIQIDYDSHLVAEGTYDVFESHPFYRMHHSIANLESFQSTGVKECTCKKGIASLSHMGAQFLSVCMP